MQLKKSKASILAVIFIVYLDFVAVSFAAVSCDGTHIHATNPSYAKGKWFGCSGSAWRDVNDSKKIYMKSSWSTTDGKFARDIIQNEYGDCIEMQVHYDGNSMGTITWGSNSSSASLDYDSGDYNIDIHVPMFGSVAYNSGYVQNWIKCGRSDVIGTSYVIQDHVSSSGKYCLDINWCALGATRSNKDGTKTDRPREWYSSWSNGERH